MNRHIPEQRIKTAAPDIDAAAQSKLWWMSSNICSPDAFLDLPDNEQCPRERLLLEWRDFYTLHQLLLSIGGYETCFPPSEEDMKSILALGRFYPGRSK